jgi:hypothetical protein
MADDAELQLFRSSVNCAAVLEVGGWKLDAREISPQQGRGPDRDP